MTYSDYYPNHLLQKDQMDILEMQMKPFDYEVGDFVWYFHHSFDKPKKLMIVDMCPNKKTLVILSGDRKFTITHIHVKNSEEACKVKHFDSEYIRNKFNELAKSVAKFESKREYSPK